MDKQTQDSQEMLSEGNPADRPKRQMREAKGFIRKMRMHRQTARITETDKRAGISGLGVFRC